MSRKPQAKLTKAEKEARIISPTVTDRKRALAIIRKAASRDAPKATIDFVKEIRGR